MVSINTASGKTGGDALTPRRREIFCSTSFQVLIIVILGLAVYSNTFHVPFHFDDESSIVQNGVIKDLSGFLSGAGYDYNPRRFIGYLTFALNYKLGELNVVGYHAFNLAVHIATALLVYALARLTLQVQGSRFNVRGSEPTIPPPSPLTPHFTFVPLLAALLFVAHPVQTQAVTYIVQRLASLATMFYLLSLVLYSRTRLFQEQGETGWKSWVGYFLSLASAAVAMKTKEIAFTLPVMVLIYEFSFFRVKAGKRLLLLLPMLLTLAIVPLSMISAGGGAAGEVLSDLRENTRVTELIPRGDYFFTQLRVIVTYIRLLFLPVNQNLDYDYPVYTSFLRPPVFLSFLFLAALFSLAIWFFYRSGLGNRDSGTGKLEEPGLGNRDSGTGNLPYYESRITNHESRITNHESRIPSSESRITNPESRIPSSESRIPSSESRIPNPESRLIAFGILWFFVTLSVESSIIPITDFIFEHRLYLPSVGFFIALAAALFCLKKRLDTFRPAPGRAFVPVMAAVVLLYAGSTYARNSVWKDGITLWEDVVRKSPSRARPHTNLGSFYRKAGRLEEALRELQTAVRLNPLYEVGRYNLGVCYEMKGRLEEAIEEYRTTLRLMPYMELRVDAHYKLGSIYGKTGRFAEAERELKNATALKPDYAEAFYNLGVVLERQGRLKEAELEFKKAIKLKADLHEAYKNTPNKSQ